MHPRPLLQLPQALLHCCHQFWPLSLMPLQALLQLVAAAEAILRSRALPPPLLWHCWLCWHCWLRLDWAAWRLAQARVLLWGCRQLHRNR